MLVVRHRIDSEVRVDFSVTARTRVRGVCDADGLPGSDDLRAGHRKNHLTAPGRAEACPGTPCYGGRVLLILPIEDGVFKFIRERQLPSGAPGPGCLDNRANLLR